MKTIILGREGNQPFPIKSDVDGVSRKHAQITITDSNEWYLEDLDSANGTCVRDETTGEMEPVTSRQRITPMTFVLLGPDNSRGCSFYAKQAEKYGDFMEEHEYLVTKESEFDRKEEILDGNIKKMRIVGPVIVIIAVFTITGIPAVSDYLGEYAMQIRIGLSSMTGIITALYDGSAKKKRLQSLREMWHHCPNPCCSNKLTTKEINNMRCSKCKK